MTDSNPSRNDEALDQGVVYKIIGQDAKPITVYAESAKEKGKFTWYRVPSWPVTFLGFEEFDLRVHKHLSGDGWVVAEATTGKSVQMDRDAETSDGPCVLVAWQITNGNITVEKMREAIVKAHAHLKEIGASPRSETVAPRDVWKRGISDSMDRIQGCTFNVKEMETVAGVLAILRDLRDNNTLWGPK